MSQWVSEKGSFLIITIQLLCALNQLSCCEAFYQTFSVLKGKKVDNQHNHQWPLLRSIVPPSKRCSMIQNYLSNDRSSTSEGDELQSLLEKASQLRREADELDAKMKETRQASKKAYLTDNKPPSYDELSDSTWLISFRFSRDPPSDEDDDSGEAMRQFYSGKVIAHFRSDGYTDVGKQKDVENDSNKNIRFDKFWGWDEEVSNEDGLTYLLFSADISFIDPSDPPKSSSERFYFQARVDKDDLRKEIKLSDGTVTVKREVLRSSTGGKLFWGIFDGGGILAQFRNVGGFSCKPVLLESD